MSFSLDDLPELIKVAKLLIKGGWLKRVGSLLDLVKELADGDLTSVLRSYQTHFGLPGGGELNQQTIEHLTLPRFCGRPDREMLAESQLQPMPEVRWWAANPGDMPGLTGQEFLEALDENWTYLPTVCGITARNVATEAEANAVIQCGPIDGSMATLAWSELWNGSPGILHQMYDDGDKWMRKAGRLQAANPLDVGRVITHESCHLLGLPHDSEDMTCLMAPTYSLTVDRCTARDIQRLQRIYGPPKSVTKPVNPDTPAKPSVPKSYTVMATVQETADGLTILLPQMSIQKVG